MTKDIVLVNPPTNREETPVRDMAGGLGFNRGATTFMTPLDLLYLARSLIRGGYNVRLIDSDAHNLDREQVIKAIQEIMPSHVISNTSLSTLKSDCSFIRSLVDLGFAVLPKTGLTYKPILKEMLESTGTGRCLVGETEKFVVEILEGTSSKGLAVLKNGELALEMAPLVQDLDELGIPPRELVDNEIYAYYPMLGDRVTLVQTSRGCPFSCYFYCPYPLVQGRKWRQRSPEHVFQELKEVVNKFSIHKVFFRDACFTLDRARTVSLCNYIIEGGLDFKWWCETRIDRLDKDLLSLMKRAGLEGINIGVETGDEDVMKSRAKQGINLKMLKEIKKFADRIGVRLHFLMLIGFPEETRMSLYKTYSLIRKLKPKSFYCTVITPYPGTELFDLAHSREWIESYDWSQYYGMTPIMHTDNLSVDELKFAHKLIMRGTHQFKSRGLRSKLELFLVQRSMRKWADGACIDDL